MLDRAAIHRDWFSNIRADVLAGLVVALALIPEAIGFSIIAGVDPRVGLYASVAIAMVIAFTGGRPGMISAATAAVAVVVMVLKFGPALERGVAEGGHAAPELPAEAGETAHCYLARDSVDADLWQLLAASVLRLEQGGADVFVPQDWSNMFGSSRVAPDSTAAPTFVFTTRACPPGWVEVWRRGDRRIVAVPEPVAFAEVERLLLGI